MAMENAKLMRECFARNSTASNDIRQIEKVRSEEYGTAGTKKISPAGLTIAQAKSPPGG